MASLATRIDRLEHALGDDGGAADCPVCAARPRITGPWTPDPEPDRCPRCGAPWTRRSFTLRLGPERGLVGDE